MHFRCTTRYSQGMHIKDTARYRVHTSGELQDPGYAHQGYYKVQVTHIMGYYKVQGTPSRGTTR